MELLYGYGLGVLVLELALEQLAHSGLSTVLGWSDVLIIDHRVFLLSSAIKNVFYPLQTFLVCFFSALQLGALRRRVLGQGSVDVLHAAVTAAAGVQRELLLGALLRDLA